MRSDLRLALEAADAADAVTTTWFRSAMLDVETKPDRTPVTEADRATERAIRDVIQGRRADDAIHGEEFGTTGRGDRRWIIDPIDATMNFVRGVPVWATLIALEDAEGVAVGVVSSPALGQRWWAGRGLGAHRNAEPMRVSGIDRIEDAHLSYNSLVALEAHGMRPQGEALSQRCAQTRGYGDFLSFMFLAAGGLEIVIEPIAAEWDLAPLIVIVEEAGGRFCDATGTRTIRGGNAIATNGALHEEVMALFGVSGTA